jgi:hypothetical protein
MPIRIRANENPYMIPLTGGTAKEISNPDSLLNNKNLSPDGNFTLSDKEVKVKKILEADKYPEMSKSNALLFDNLDQRHWG